MPIDPQRLAMIMARMGGQGGQPMPPRPMGAPPPGINAPPGPAPQMGMPPMPPGAMPSSPVGGPPPPPGAGNLGAGMPLNRVGGPFGGLAQNGPRQGAVGAGMPRRY